MMVLSAGGLLGGLFDHGGAFAHILRFVIGLIFLCISAWVLPVRKQTTEQVDSATGSSRHSYAFRVAVSFVCVTAIAILLWTVGPLIEMILLDSGLI